MFNSFTLSARPSAAALASHSLCSSPLSSIDDNVQPHLSVTFPGWISSSPPPPLSSSSPPPLYSTHLPGRGTPDFWLAMADHDASIDDAASVAEGAAPLASVVVLPEYDADPTWLCMCLSFPEKLGSSQSSELLVVQAAERFEQQQQQRPQTLVSLYVHVSPLPVSQTPRKSPQQQPPPRLDQPLILCRTGQSPAMCVVSHEMGALYHEPSLELPNELQPHLTLASTCLVYRRQPSDRLETSSTERGKAPPCLRLTREALYYLLIQKAPNTTPWARFDVRLAAYAVPRHARTKGVEPHTETRYIHAHTALFAR